MQTRQKRKAENHNVLNHDKKRRRRGQGFNPGKKYVLAKDIKPVIITNLSSEEMQAGIDSGQIITLDAHKQRRLVYELDGSPLDYDVVADTKKIKKLLKSGKVITATTYRNRLMALHRDKLEKITRYKKAMQIALELTARLPSPDVIVHYYFQEEILKTLSTLPVCVLRKMGLYAKKTQGKHSSNNHGRTTYVNLERYKKWYAEARQASVHEEAEAAQAEKSCAETHDSRPASPAAQIIEVDDSQTFSMWSQSVTPYLSACSLFAGPDHQTTVNAAALSQQVDNDLLLAAENNNSAFLQEQQTRIPYFFQTPSALATPPPVYQPEELTTPLENLFDLGW